MVEKEIDKRRRKAILKKKSGDKLVLKDETSLRKTPHANYTMIEQYAGRIVTFDYMKYGETFPAFPVFKIKEDDGNWFWTLGMVDIL